MPSLGVRACRATLLLLLAGAATPLAAAPLLPDLISWASEQRRYMYGGEFDTTTIPNKVLYRFDGALPNIGAGPLEIREETHAHLTQDVYQRIYDSDGAITERLIGSFPDANPPPCCHLHLPGIAQYNLRAVTAGDGVGEILSSNDKTSMAVVDGTVYDTTLPGAPSSSVYKDVEAELLGISVGWGDRYPRNLPGQWVEVTGLPDGQYWLEVIADPYDRILELDETNNTTRILIDLEIPAPAIWPGDYNDDGTVDAADYTRWRDTLGQALPAGTGADGNGNGLVDLADYQVWQLQFGNPGGPPTAVTAVPEPTWWPALGLLWGVWRFRSKTFQ